MKYFLRAACCSLAVCFSLGTALAEDAPVLLRFKFKADEQLVYKMVTESTMVTLFDGAEEKVENSTTSQKRYKVIRVEPNGSADLEVMFDSIKMRAKVADNPAEEFDSSQKDEVERVDFRKIKETVGKPQAVLRFATNGKLDQIVKVEQTDLAPHPDEFQTMLLTLPNEPVKVGTEWSEPFKVRVGVEGEKLTQEIAMSRKYKVESIEGNLVKLSMRTAVLTPVRSNYVAVQLSQREMQGEILFDNERGAILSRNLKAAREIVNAFGEKTLFNARTVHTEKLVDPNLPPEENAAPNSPDASSK